jgi:hypothetical protein
MPGRGSKRNYDPSRASVLGTASAGTRAGGRDDPAALPGCADDVDWRAAAARVSPVGCIPRCNSGAHGRSASKERRSPDSPCEDKSAATVPFPAPPCLKQAGWTPAPVSCQFRPVCSVSPSHGGDDIRASTVDAVGAPFLCRLSCPPYSVPMIGRMTAPPAPMRLPPAQRSENYVFR